MNALHVYNGTHIAETAVGIYYKNPNADDTNANAFKHAYWSGILLKAMSRVDAIMWVTAHEQGSPSAIATEMDFHNNKLGREIYTALGNPTGTGFAEAIMKRIDKGDLRRVVNKKLVPTDNTGKN